MTSEMPFHAAERTRLRRGRALIESVGRRTHAQSTRSVYWQTHESNAAGRLLYDRVAKHHGFLVDALDV
jgi:hypothetical protein